MHTPTLFAGYIKSSPFTGLSEMNYRTVFHSMKFHYSLTDGLSNQQYASLGNSNSQFNTRYILSGGLIKLQEFLINSIEVFFSGAVLISLYAEKYKNVNVFVK